MEVAQPDRRADLLSFLFAGLQAGMLAAMWMLAWLGVCAVWQRSSFWTAENLLASTFFGTSAIRSGFSLSTFSGIALYLFIYSALGCLFALGLRNRLARPQLLLLLVLLSVAWYYLSFHGFWKIFNPLMALLHAERPMILGHFLYGVVIARYPKYLNSRPVSDSQIDAVQPDSQVVVADSEKTG